MLAKDLGVAVMALCQLSRQAEHRDDKRPQLPALPRLWSIEQDADTVLGLYREADHLYCKPHRTPDEEDRLLANQDVLELELQTATARPAGSSCSAPCRATSSRRP